MRGGRLLSTTSSVGACALIAVGLVATCSSGESEAHEPEVRESGHLGLPRLFFIGEVRVNVGTANNNNVLPVTLPKTATLNPAYVAQYPTRDEFRTFMQTPAEGANGQTGIVGGWNYYGNMRAHFEGVTITGAQLDYGADPTTTPLGALAGSTLRSPTSVMADIHPAAVNFSTRWIFEHLFLQNPSGDVLARLPLGAANFYWFVGPTVRYFFTLTNAEARAALGNTHGGELLTEFHERIAEGAGLDVDVRLGFEHGMPSEEGMAEKFAKGEQPINVFRGELQGVITPWYGAVESEQPRSRYLQGVGEAQGLVVVRENVQTHFITLDFGSAIVPKDPGTEKLPVLELVWESDAEAGKTETLGNIQPSAYTNHAVAELVDLPLDTNVVLSAGDMDIKDGSGKVLFRERTKVVAPTTLGAWFDEGESRTLQARLFDHGRLRDTGPIYMQQYGFDKARGGYFKDVALLETPATATIENGVASFSAKAIGPGQVKLAYSDDDDLPDSFSDLDEVFTTFIRVLPEYDDAAVSDEELTWELLYRDVLQYYDVVFPAMTSIYDIADENTMRLGAAFVLGRLVEIGPQSPHFMPVTRDLPIGKRRLLVRWLRNATAK